MSLPNVGGGYQVGDGNLNEIIMGSSAAPQSATSTATLTVGQLTGGLLVGNPSTTAATYTSPTGAQIDSAMNNAKVGSTFDFTVINLGTSTGLITVAAGAGVTIVGNAIVPVAGSAAGDCNSAMFRFRRTGDSAWTAYRIA